MEFVTLNLYDKDIDEKLENAKMHIQIVQNIK